MQRVVAYFRVSTEGQGRSGLGLEAQRQAVTTLCERRGWQIIGEHTEIESGKRADRPELALALQTAKVTGAVLVIAKLDRLSRSVAFLAALQDSGARFIAADMPEADETMVHVMAAFAQRERKAISTRTREALQAAKARGVKLGNPTGAAPLLRAGKGNVAGVEAVKAGADRFARDLAPIVTDLRAGGVVTLAGIAQGLNDRHVRTPRGGKWHPSSVKNLLARLDS